MSPLSARASIALAYNLGNFDVQACSGHSAGAVPWLPGGDGESLDWTQSFTRFPMRTFYPEIQPYDVGTLKVDDRHTLYYEQCGNPNGKPVLLLHGGPGAGCSPKMRCFHDPLRYRIVLFDQRGSGRSTPHADLVDNSTWHLVADIEKLRTKLGIERWQVFGGSWGSTLALAYAETHPQRVTELVLRGIFMLRRWELEWFYQEGASRLFPDAWEHYLRAIPVVERHDLISAFHRRLTSDDEATCLAAARAWSV